jgi:nicotinamidase-related amidase
MTDRSATTPRRALIVIDVQQEYFAGGGLPIEHPPVERSLPQILRAMDAARDARVPVVVVQHDAAAGAPVFVPGSALWQLHPEVAARPHELLVRKHQPSALAGTPLAPWLREHGIDTLTIAGYMTHNCDASTVFEAFHAGFGVEVLSDASGALPYRNDAGAASAEEIHRVFSVVFHSNFAAVATTGAWIDALRTGQALPRDNVVASNRRAREARG